MLLRVLLINAHVVLERERNKSFHSQIVIRMFCGIWIQCKKISGVWVLWFSSLFGKRIVETGQRERQPSIADPKV